MLLISCPWCGERGQIEFTCHGEAHIARPQQPDALSDEEWGEYLFFRKNRMAVHHERWFHAYGCRRWFYAVRHTVTDEIFATYRPGDPIPEFAGDRR